MWWFPDFPGLSPSIIINTRSSVKPAKMLINQIDIRPVEHYAQQYVISRFQDQNQAGEKFWAYKYTPNGYAEAGDYERAKELFESFSAKEWKANDETDEEADTSGGGARGGTAQSDDPNSKF